MMKKPDAWDREGDAMDLAMSIYNPTARASALKAIADRMCTKTREG